VVDSANQTPSIVFPIPGFTGPVSLHHGETGAIGGTDLMANTGTPIVSMVSGEVVASWTEKQMPGSGGNAIEIKGLDGLTYYYAHMLNAPTLKRGDKVAAGQQIGQVNQSGNARTTPPHLHIGIGHGIEEGLGAFGGLGKSYDAVARLQALVKDPRANNPQFGDAAAAPNPPSIAFVPSVPGFTSDKAGIIKTIIEEAIAAGVDPFIVLGIVSTESTFNPGAQNPSGACGLMQLLPCIPNGFDPVTNVREGIKRWKDKLTACNGNVDCALNAYSGGGGASYIHDVKTRAAGIKTANPDLSSGVSLPPGISDGGTGGFDTGNLPSEDCPPINFGKIGPADIKIPNPACIIAFALKNMVTTLSNWWGQWQTEHIPNWTFVILGIIFIIIGGLALANSSGMQPPNIQMAKSVAGGGAAAEVAEVAAVV
jgi:hypothetical protein